MNYSQHAKTRRIKLELHWYQPKGRKTGSWRKTKTLGEHKHVKYFHHPDTRQGYEAAVMEMHSWLGELQDNRINVSVWKHHKEIFKQVHEYYQQFGATSDETEVAELVQEYLDWLDEQMRKPELPDKITFIELLVETKGKFLTVTVFGESFGSRRVRRRSTGFLASVCPEMVLIRCFCGG